MEHLIILSVDEIRAEVYLEQTDCQKAMDCMQATNIMNGSSMIRNSEYFKINKQTHLTHAYNR